jgi:hypothetical protein
MDLLQTAARAQLEARFDPIKNRPAVSNRAAAFDQA